MQAGKLHFLDGSLKEMAAEERSRLIECLRSVRDGKTVEIPQDIMHLRFRLNDTALAELVRLSAWFSTYHPMLLGCSLSESHALRRLIPRGTSC